MKRIVSVLLTLVITFSLLSAVGNVNAKTLKNANVPEKAKSMGITKKNYDISKVHITYDLSEDQKAHLINLGYKAKKVNSMDLGDYLKVIGKQSLTEKDIELVIKSHPELDKKNLVKWTYNDYDAYIIKENKKHFKIEDSLLKEFTKRGITEDDAQLLKKKYETYENILLQDDKVLKSDIESIYDDNTNYVNSMNGIEQKKTIDIASNFGFKSYAMYTVDPDYDHLYVKITVFDKYLYLPDNVLLAAGTHISSTRLVQETNAIALYKNLYDVSSIPSGAGFTNIWGAYASTKRYPGYGYTGLGPHEGIDLDDGNNHSPIYSPYDGYVAKAETGKVVLWYTKDGIKKSMIILHLDNVPAGLQGTTISQGTKLGEQCNRGLGLPLDNHTKLSHVHYVIEAGYTLNTTAADANHVLDSANPYDYPYNGSGGTTY